VVPYGTDIPVLQFNVTLNSDLPLGAETGLTLLQDGTINGQTKYTAISDNAGALTWTPGMAPSNSGNAAIDGSVTVVPVLPTPVAPAQQRPVLVQPKVVEPVRRVTPVIQSELMSPATSAILVVPWTRVEVPTLIEDTVANPGALLSSSLAVVQPEASVVNVTLTVAPEVVPIANVATSPLKSSDPGVSLSLVAVGTNKAAPVVSAGPASTKPSTIVLDELYRQLGTAPGNGYNLGGSVDSSTAEWSDVWLVEMILADLDSRGNSDEPVLP
jgi:hypothetical protein